MTAATRSNLVRLGGPDAGSPPVVLVLLHSSSGSAGGFRRLRARLTTPVRCVAFEATEPGPADRCSVPAVAQDYWHELTAVLAEEPHAALVLVGWSFGGLVAVEMARLAAAAHRPVAHVVLLDAAPPRVLRDRVADRGGVTGIAALFGLDAAAPAVAALDQDTDQDFDEQALAVALRDALDLDLAAADLVPIIRTHRWHVRALTAPWTPVPLTAPVTLVRARDERGWADAPPDLGWSVDLAAAVDVVWTPGTHASLVSGPHVEPLAWRLDRIVDQIGDQIGAGALDPTTDAAGGPDPAAAGLALSSAQARLWFLWLLEPGKVHYTTQFGWHIPDATPEQVRRAWRTVCDRHPLLRSRYRTDAGGTPRRFVDPDSPVVVETLPAPDAPGSDRAGPTGTTDVTGITAVTDVTGITAVAERLFREPFDLAGGSVRAVVADAGDGAAWLLVSCHHIAVDGWCLGVVEHELRDLLRAPTTALPPPAADYQDFVVWEQEVRRRASFAEELDLWADALADLAVVPPAADASTDAEPGAAALRFHLGASVAAGLDAAASASATTPFAVLLTCVGLALREWAGTAGVAVAVNLANRPTEELEDVVGLFVDPVPLWLRPPADQGFGAATEHVWDRLAEALDRSDVPYQDVVARVGGAERDTGSPLFWTIVNFHQEPGRRSDDERWRPVPAVTPPEVKFPFAVLIEQDDDGIAVEFLYPRDRYRASTVVRVRDRVEQLATTLAEHGPDVAVPPPTARSSGGARFAARFGARHRPTPPHESGRNHP